ncbi:hypothetical protein Pcinc_006074 [Petrolisthes cinctipes]|uniref:Uncharacterized protein n=1 Tax=Petrolisthes cinctipes TaxID=88211 RepID=A0AAE1GC27_PETCI|nr:hypothetical protein Pcinc_006074 [Petrolisthes cinctipes]
MEERVRVRLRRRIVPDRSNPFEDLAEEQFLLRFRLSKECVLNLLQNITEQLPIAADAREESVRSPSRSIIGTDTAWVTLFTLEPESLERILKPLSHGKAVLRVGGHTGHLLAAEKTALMFPKEHMGANWAPTVGNMLWKKTLQKVRIPSAARKKTDFGAPCSPDLKGYRKGEAAVQMGSQSTPSCLKASPVARRAKKLRTKMSRNVP